MSDIKNTDGMLGIFLKMILKDEKKVRQRLTNGQADCTERGVMLERTSDLF